MNFIMDNKAHAFESGQTGLVVQKPHQNILFGFIGGKTMNSHVLAILGCRFFLHDVRKGFRTEFALVILVKVYIRIEYTSISSHFIYHVFYISINFLFSFHSIYF